VSSIELKGLKGLSGLDGLLSVSKSMSKPTDSVHLLSLRSLISGKYQPRIDFNSTSLQELAQSIRAQGIIQPLIVRSIAPEQYEIIAGERRWRAAEIAGLKEVPAIIRNVPDETALAFALIENIQRENLNPIEEAFALERLKNEFLLTHEDIAERVGRSRSAVTNLLRLLTLNGHVRQLIILGQIEMGHARALLSLDSESQAMAVEIVVNKKLSVRATEQLVKKLKSPLKAIEDKKFQFPEKISYWSETLSKQLSSKVQIQLNNKGGGKIIINVDSPHEIDWLIEKTKIN
jgi:ParB family chromosome partitioning protein